MRTKNCLFIVLIVSSLSGVAVASADTMAITYRSGKVQNVAMDLPSEEVQAISYFKTAMPPSEIKAKGLLNKPAHAAGDAGEEQSPDSKKQGATIKWAPPIDQ